MLYYPRKDFLPVREFLLHFMYFWMFTPLSYLHTACDHFFLLNAWKTFFLRAYTSLVAQRVFHRTTAGDGSNPFLSSEDQTILLFNCWASFVIHVGQFWPFILCWILHITCVRWSKPSANVIPTYFPGLLLLFLPILSFHLYSFLLSFLSVCTERTSYIHPQVKEQLS